MHDVLGALISVPLQTEGVFDWINQKNTAAMAAARGLSVTVAIIFVIITAAASRMAAARVIISGIIAAVFVWVVFNVTKLEDRVDNEMSISPIGTVHTTGAPTL